MPTININGNIRTNTAAGWAADATVYSAKTILVTTDAVYGTTDQRKFKIADGTQTWTNLDYFPVSGYDDASSSIQTQLNTKHGYTLTANAPTLNPADSTTYYFGAAYTATTTTTPAIRRVYIPKAGTIKSIYLFGTCTPGDNNAVSFYLRLNNTTDTTISTTVDMSASPFTANATGLSVAVAADDYFEIKEITPAWPTSNPTAQLVNIVVYIE